MGAPPGLARTSSSTRSVNSSGSAIEDLKVAARTVLWNCGVNYGPHKINRLCVQFAERVRGNGFDFFDFLANKVQLTAEDRRRALSNPDIQRVIAYRDRTGEDAVRNVLQERGF